MQIICIGERSTGQAVQKADTLLAMPSSQFVTPCKELQAFGTNFHTDDAALDVFNTPLSPRKSDQYWCRTTQNTTVITVNSIEGKLVHGYVHTRARSWLEGHKEGLKHVQLQEKSTKTKKTRWSAE